MSLMLLAAAFVNPALLWGLGLGVVPILIHLLARRQVQLVDWGAMQFLLEAERENRRRVQLEQWLLLALRCLAMSLLGLVFARPFVQPGWLEGLLGGGDRVERIIVIDDSASLGYRGGTQPDLEQLKSAAQRFVEWLEQSSASPAVRIYRVTDPATPIFASNALDVAELSTVSDRLRKLAPSALAARPAEFFKALADRLRTERPPAVDIYIFSDFQRTDWLAGERRGADAFDTLKPLLERSDQSPIRVSLRLAGVGGILRNNVAVVGGGFARSQVIAGMPAVLRLEIANFSDTTLPDLPLELSLDDQTLAAVSASSIEPGKTASIATEVTPPTAGYHRLSVGIAPRDGLSADDKWLGAIDVRSAIRALIVNGAPSRLALQDEVHLLRNALAPPGPFSSGIQVDVVEPEELGAVRFDGYDVVLVCNAAPPEDSVVRALQRFVAAGAGLFISVGDSIGGADAFNRAWSADSESPLPLQLGDVVVLGADSEIGLRRAVEDSLTALLPGESDALPEYIRFRAFNSSAAPPLISPDANKKPLRRETRVLARFTDAATSPALAFCDYGRGRVIMLTSSVDLDWNDWARSVDGSYVVTMLEIVQFLAAQSQHPIAFTAGETLRLAVSPEAYEASGLFRTPRFPVQPAVPAQFSQPELMPGDLLQFQGPRAVDLGWYTAELTTRGGAVEERPLAANLPAGESDLAVAARSELSAAIGDVPHEFIDLSSAAFSKGDPPRRELWRTLLFLAAGLLLLEQLLAWIFGGGLRGRWRRTQLAGS